MNITSNSLYGTSSYAMYGSSTSSSNSLSSKFAEALLTSLDSDSSGSVDSTEFSSAALELANGDTSAVNDAFSSLDSNKDGSITIDELTSMLSAQSTMTSGSMPPPPPSSSQGKEDNGKTKDELTAMAEEVSSTDSNLASLLSSVAENFDAADANSDGKVTSAEAMAYQRSSQETSTSVTDASNVAASGSMPPPPPPPSSSTQEDTGYTKDELTAMASDVSSTDSNLASLFESLAQNFDAADTNSDGKVTSAEAQAYKDSTRADSIGVANTATASSSDSLMKALLAQIISNYATQNTLSSSSVSFSA